MNKDLFLKCIENNRDCNQEWLDAAVNRGLRRAKNDRIDPKKIFILAAACVFTFMICITINLMPVSTVVERYYRNRQKIMPGSSEVLSGYIKDITVNLEKYLGGE
jgi:hypothetical protein